MSAALASVRMTERSEVLVDGGRCKEVFEGVELVVVLGGPDPRDILAKQDVELGAGRRQVRQVCP